MFDLEDVIWTRDSRLGSSVNAVKIIQKTFLVIIDLFNLNEHGRERSGIKTFLLDLDVAEI